MDVDEMINLICIALDEIEGIEDRDQWTDEEWTKRIKTAFCAVGNRRHYLTCAAGVPNADQGEWLYDVCWLEYNGDWLQRMPMAAESEWGNRGAIEDDFSKLLVARASLRVMVCDTGYLPEDAETLRQWVHMFEGGQVGDSYLLIVYEWYENQWRSHSNRYRLDVTPGGELQPL